MKRKVTIVIFMTAAAMWALGFTACAGIFDKSPFGGSSGADKSATFLNAEKAFLKGDYEKVLTIYSVSGRGWKSSDDDLQYLAGRAFLKLGRFSEARNCFSRVINDSDEDSLLDEAYIGLGDSYYLEGDYKTAITHYEKVAEYFPDADGMHLAYYKLGECYNKLGDKSASKMYYDKLISSYPYSFETKLLSGEAAGPVTYSVQTGSFESWNNAKKLYDELNGKGFEAGIYTAIVGSRRFYRVRVGQYSRLSDAEEMALTLRNRGYSVKIYP